MSGPKQNMKTAVYVTKDGIVESKSVLSAITGGNVDDKGITGNNLALAPKK